MISLFPSNIAPSAISWIIAGQRLVTFYMKYNVAIQYKLISRNCSEKVIVLSNFQETNFMYTTYSSFQTHMLKSDIIIGYFSFCCISSVVPVDVGLFTRLMCFASNCRLINLEWERETNKTLMF